MKKILFLVAGLMFSSSVYASTVKFVCIGTGSSNKLPVADLKGEISLGVYVRMGHSKIAGGVAQLAINETGEPGPETEVTIGEGDYQEGIYANFKGYSEKIAQLDLELSFDEKTPSNVLKNGERIPTFCKIVE